jgi:hypothetical protein
MPKTPINTWPIIPGFACRSRGDAVRRNPYDLAGIMHELSSYSRFLLS